MKTFIVLSFLIPVRGCISYISVAIIKTPRSRQFIEDVYLDFWFPGDEFIMAWKHGSRWQAWCLEEEAERSHVKSHT